MQSHRGANSAERDHDLMDFLSLADFLFFVWKSIYLCVRECCCNVNFFMNALSHTLHLNGFSPVCIISCLCRYCFVLNECWHLVHLNGFSPVCVLVCFWRFPFEENNFWQVWHLNFSIFSFEQLWQNVISFKNYVTINT